MVKAGDTLDFGVQGQTTTTWLGLTFTPGQLTAEIIRILGEKMDVVSVDLESGDTIITGVLPWSFKGAVRVRTRGAYAQPQDVGSIIANAVYRASGTMPIVTVGRPVAFNPPELSWKVVVGIAAAAILIIALKVD